MEHLAIFGAGHWGTAIAVLLSKNKNNNICIYSHTQSVVNDININNKNSTCFSDIFLEANISATSNLQDLVECQYIFLALPVQSTARLLKEFAKYNIQQKCFVVCSKGIDCKTLSFISDMVNIVLPNNEVSLLSGPNFAQEVMENHCLATTVACTNLELAHKIKNLLYSNRFKVSITNDIYSVQMSGAIKNIIAILCGMARASGFSNNEVAAILTMGMQEIMKLSIATGGKMETLLDYCGIGDLVLTCYSQNSRNTNFGMEFATGKAHADCLAEGFYSAKAIIELSKKLDIINIPVCQAAYNILYENHDMTHTLQKLFT